MFRLARFLSAYKKQVVLGPIFKLTEAVLALIVYFGWNRRGGKIPDEERRDLFGISQK